MLTPLLVWLHRRPHREGDLFKAFMVVYLGFRLLLEVLKPGVFFGGLNAIQWACLGTLLYYGWLYYRSRDTWTYDGEQQWMPPVFRSRPGRSKPVRARQVTGG